MSTGGKLYNIDFIIEDEIFYSTKGYYKKEPIKTKIVNQRNVFLEYYHK